MNHKQSPHNLDLTSLEQPDDLDDLLLKSPLPQPEPWFVAETMALCRREGQRPARSFASLFWSFRAGLSVAAFAAAAACFLVVGYSVVAKPSTTVAESPKKPVADAFLVVASVDSNMEEECDETSPM